MHSKKLFGGVIAHIFYSTILVATGIFIGTKWYHYAPWYTPLTEACAIIFPLNESKVTGLVTFTQEKNGVRVNITCQNLTPGKHGCHIHEHGDARCADGMCTGEHFNPTHKKHGGLNSPERHVGDFGNLEADSTGTAQTEFVLKDLMLNGPGSILGRAVIVHAQEDDLTSQPSGNSGARIACGVIGSAKNKQ